MSTVTSNSTTITCTSNPKSSRNSIILTQSMVCDTSNYEAIIEDSCVYSPNSQTFTLLPTNPLPLNITQQQKKKFSPKMSVFYKTGYLVKSKIAKTLQGSIYNIENSEGNKGVLKRASANLHDAKIAKVNGKLYKVEENIVNEANILKYLNSFKNKPLSLIKYIDFFCDGHNYYLLMENGGKSLFEHIQNMHYLLKNKLLKFNEYKKHIKILFKQMILFINWLHNTVKYVHLDISLENMLIKNVDIKNGKFINHGIIKFIDFGLSEKYNKKFTKCKKYVGKTKYKSPNIYNEIPFNAFKADIWSLGVVLFVMLYGMFPYNKPILNDEYFYILWHKHANGFCEIYNIKQSSTSLEKLLDRIFCAENKRISISKIIKFLKL